ncbi:MAG: PRD domain-containing protein [Anaerolineales bacterium]|nr:PRD domain-containing protein [Anaerolineales bacterium]
MPFLDTRQASIVLALLEANGPVSAHSLGEKLDLSARVIRYNIPLIRRWLTAFKAKLTTQPRVGLALIANEDVRSAISNELTRRRFPVFFKPTERQKHLLFDLLTHDAYRTGQDLVSQLSISQATLARDLAKVESWLEKHNLYLQRRPRLGTIIVGREDDLRHALISLILETVLESALLELCVWGKQPKAEGRILIRNPLQATMLESLSNWNLDDAWRFISRIQDGLGFSIAESDHLSLALYWAVMVQRYRSGHPISIPASQVEAQQRQPEYRAIESAADLLERETGTRLPPIEQAQLTLEVLTSARRAHPRDHVASRTALEIPAQYLDLADRIVNEIGLRLGADLNHPEVLTRLAEHLSRTMIRLRHGMPIRNPLVHEVRRAYPETWAAVTDTCEIISREIDLPLPAEEIAYITMYVIMAQDLNRRLKPTRGPRVVVACPTGGVTVWMLLSRLRTELPELEIVGVVSLLHLHKIDPDRINAIISTVELTYHDLPVITISPLVNEEEVQRIRRELHLISTEFGTKRKA